MKITEMFNTNDLTNITDVSVLYIYLHEHRNDSLNLFDLFYIEDEKIKLKDEVNEFFRKAIVNGDQKVVSKVQMCREVLLNITFPLEKAFVSNGKKEKS